MSAYVRVSMGEDGSVSAGVGEVEECMRRFMTSVPASRTTADKSAPTYPWVLEPMSSSWEEVRV